jgi:membrane protein DedA with SNARE-associated domain
VLQQVVNLVTQYGYLAVFVLMLAESACIPVPSEVVMMFGGALAAGAVGHGAPPSLLGVVAAGVLGNVAGSYLAWAVGKYAGQAAIKRWGRRIGIREHEIDRAVAWFDRHGPVAVLVGRVIPVIRTFISLPAGFANMPASRFGLYTALGCIPWTAALGIAGYALGANWDQVAKDFNGPTYAVAGILLVAVVVIVVRRRRARNAAQAGSAGAGGGGRAKQTAGSPTPPPPPPPPRCHARPRRLRRSGDPRLRLGRRRGSPRRDLARPARQRARPVPGPARPVPGPAQRRPGPARPPSGSPRPAGRLRPGGAAGRVGRRPAGPRPLGAAVRSL